MSEQTKWWNSLLELGDPMDLKQVETFFFRAMIEGWASGAEKIRIPEMPGYKGIEFEEGGFRLLDLWCTTPNSLKSTGTTTIWFGGIPLWFMSYGGYYEEEAIPTVKQALLDAYQARVFLGGRGTALVDREIYAYSNLPEFRTGSGEHGFAHFRGREEVFHLMTKKPFGFHEYWGMSLV